MRRAILILTLMGAMLFAFAGAVIAQTTGPSNQQPGQPSTAAQAHRPVCAPPAAGSTHCHSHVITDSKGKPNATTSPTGYGPDQFRVAYGLNAASTSNGAGQTIAIVDAYDDPTAESDLGVYSSTYGLPSCTTANGCFQKVGQSGGTPPTTVDGGWALEISLDVQTAHAICPNCKILLVEANSNSFADLLTAEDYAAAHANVVSNSWGSSEFSSETSYDSHFNRPGIPITVSSGDNGYGVEYPAASQFVNAVGGTTLSLNPDNTRRSEMAWSGAGSGCSAYETTKPSWQKDSGCLKRTVADVAADADPNTGASVYDSTPYNGSTGWFQVGGTSLASPLIASVYALAGNAASTTAGSYPYSHTSSLFDVTSGSNGNCVRGKKGSTSTGYLCTGAVGYDGPTGNGTPNGTSGF